jgi:DNA-binding MarR family transcriptional regulator
MTLPPPPAPERLARLCHAIYDRMRARVYAEAAKRGFPDLRPAHSSLLRHITPDGSRVVQLADRAGMTKQSMAYLAESLMKLGYVAIAPDPSDGRAKLVTLTDRGLNAVATLERLSTEAETAIAAQIGMGEIAALRSGLTDVLNSLR